MSRPSLFGSVGSASVPVSPFSGGAVSSVCTCSCRSGWHVDSWPLFFIASSDGLCQPGGSGMGPRLGATPNSSRCARRNRGSLRGSRQLPIFLLSRFSIYCLVFSSQVHRHTCGRMSPDTVPAKSGETSHCALKRSNRRCFELFTVQQPVIGFAC